MPSRSIALVLLASELDRTHAAHEAVHNFVDIYEREADRIVIVGPETIDIDRSAVEPVPVERPTSSAVPSRVLSYVRYQLRIAAALWRRRHTTETVFFHIGGSMLLLPLLANKLARLQTLVFVLGSIEDGFYAQHGETFLTRQFGRAIALVEGVTCTLADDVLLLSKRMNTPGLPWPFSPTTQAANLNYIDCTAFAKRTPVEERSTDVVFVGRFAAVKGVDRIVRTLPELVESNPDIRVTLIGAGSLFPEVEAVVERHDLSDNVTLTGWVDHEELPAYLDDAKVLLLPSESEGVPKALLEAMACGTVPVATPVGGVPDIVTDGKDGVLLRETNSAAIDRTISRVLERDDLGDLSDTARETIRREHAYPVVRDRYHRILHDSTRQR
ncbi:glycosyltransferase [Natrialba asiatica]|uniref:Glycosyl transferase, group 1 n=1 Tax=Natrialba asiatica (strain ATCC 700177 / DSM 12278 / JCM 9576 / FERM P-10747 / NBRC 102637 / 172P1) TaxID=29540 RepID=M0B5F6_NATA1|nr:glycosyltransferase [Natrialba asiatica]ELZ06015.1 glycosyl transferase, group 1 [Natrialba asiatica DSM 12278]